MKCVSDCWNPPCSHDAGRGECVVSVQRRSRQLGHRHACRLHATGSTCARVGALARGAPPPRAALSMNIDVPSMPWKRQTAAKACGVTPSASPSISESSCASSSIAAIVAGSVAARIDSSCVSKSSSRGTPRLSRRGGPVLEGVDPSARAASAVCSQRPCSTSGTSGTSGASGTSSSSRSASTPYFFVKAYGTCNPRPEARGFPAGGQRVCDECMHFSRCVFLRRQDDGGCYTIL